MNNQESKINVNINTVEFNSALIAELLKTQAYVRSLATMLLKKDELSEFYELVPKHAVELWKAFEEENPDLIKK